MNTNQNGLITAQGGGGGVGQTTYPGRGGNGGAVPGLPAESSVQMANTLYVYAEGLFKEMEMLEAKLRPVSGPISAVPSSYVRVPMNSPLAEMLSNVLGKLHEVSLQIHVLMDSLDLNT